MHDQWQSQEFIFEGVKHKIRRLIISVYILIIIKTQKCIVSELPSPKLVHEPRFFKLNYHPLNIMTKILKNTNNLKIFK